MTYLHPYNMPKSNFEAPLRARLQSDLRGWSNSILSVLGGLRKL